jgi:hypothetical protein
MRVPENLAAPFPEPTTRVEIASLLLPGLTFLFHLITIKGYGYFRDELYYLANAEHLGLGYVDHPPMIGLITAAVRATLGDSLVAIRLLPAVAAAATVWLVMLTARELGGGRRAQTLAGLATMLAPAYIGIFGFLSMNAFDILLWAAAFLLVARILRTGRHRLWLLFGVIAGVGLQNKISFFFVGFGIVAGLLLSRRWPVFRKPAFWLGGLVAAIVFSPYLAWQASHGWPLLEFMENARRFKNVQLGIAPFMAEQVLLTNFLALPLWLGGLAFLLFNRAAAVFRPLGWSYLAMLCLMLVSGDAKPYYLAPAYTVLFAAGAVALTGLKWRSSRQLQAAMVVMIVAGGALSAPLAKPLLPVEMYIAYANALGIRPSSGERHAEGRLPQNFADRHGWAELAETVAAVYKALEPVERQKACIFGQNYGQAGAIDLFGRRHGLPKAISAHNSYHLWGPRDCSGEVLIVIGDTRETLEQAFETVQLGAVFTCPNCMPYENNKPIWVARNLRQPLVSVWPAIKKFS